MLVTSLAGVDPPAEFPGNLATTGGSAPPNLFVSVGLDAFDVDLLVVMLGRLLLAAVLGAFIAYRIWRRFMPWQFERTESGAQTLIAVAGALMTTVIAGAGDFAGPLAFALVGLGGFIRFRSGIKDPREAGVMFLMIGIGMACGIGQVAIAMCSTFFGAILLVVLDYAEKHRRQVARRRIRFGDVRQPRQLEPELRSLIAKVAPIRGSRISMRRDEIVIDIYGSSIVSAGQVLAMCEEGGIELHGDISCEEL